MVYNWYGDFKHGRQTDVSDLPKPGRTKSVTTEDNKEMIRKLILESEGMGTDLLYETQLLESGLLRILKEINAKKIKSRWVSHELTERQNNPE